MRFLEPEWDGTNRIEVIGETKPIPRDARVSARKMRNVHDTCACYDAWREGRARLGPIQPNGTREIIIRNQPTGKFVSLELANKLRGRKDEAVVEDPFDGSTPLGSAHPDGQAVAPMVHGMEMPK